MSIQFRTKSLTSVDYSSYISNSSVNGCCYFYESGQIVTEENSNLSRCNEMNGYFSVGVCDSNVSIRPSSIGCCCSCKANEETNGTNPLTETTLCECNSFSGKWTLGPCDPNVNRDVYCKSGSIIQSNVIDFREKKACCHPEINTDLTAFPKCTDVCSEKECAEKTIFPYTSTFYNNGRKCTEQVGSAAPVEDECALSNTNIKLLNSCENGSNLFCWNTASEFRCDYKYLFFDNYFPGRYVEDVNQHTVQIRNQNSNSYFSILGTRFPQFNLPISDYAYSGNVTVNKLCAGSLSFDNDVRVPERFSEGYFAILDGNNIPRYYQSPSFRLRYFDTPQFSPVPSIIPNASVVDMIATRTFSIIIEQNNIVKIYGRFYDGRSNAYRTFNNFSTKLLKVYQHNTCPIGFDTHRSIPEYSTIGFVGQKTNKTYDYYSPFLTENTQSQLYQIREMIRSLPPKDYIKVSFGTNTFCGIDQNGIMDCVSLNSELVTSYPINRRYKHVSCTSTLIPPNEFVDPICDYCFAVDEDNKFIKMTSTNIEFTSEPVASVTDVIALSCFNNYCLSAVEPDENICNSQMLGACCTCGEQTDTVNCTDTTQGNCTGLGGHFRQGEFCSSGYCDTINNCDSSNNTTFRSIQVEETLPNQNLTYYQDGLYVGIFEPGNPINEIGSTINGNALTGKSQTYIPNVFGYGTTSKKWAIIIAPTDYELVINQENEVVQNILASTYDGIWNTYGDNINYFGIQSISMEILRNKSKLSGWYLPSKNELEFINYRLNHGFFIPEVFKSFNNGIYLTSTPYFEYISDNNFKIDNQIFGQNSFMYGQSFKKNDYGDIYLVPRTSKVNVRLIRRIELE